MSAPLAEGALFAGRYRIVRLVAQGGMGAVYEVIHTETNRRRALKVMHPHIFESDDMRERFKREARVSAEVESEHIVDVSDAGIDESSRTPFLVMELLRGEELAKRVKRIGALPPSEVLTYLRQTAIALDKTHAAAIVHRDLKPDNLFLTHRDDGSPRIKILDFGVAKVMAEGASGHATQNLGTPLYMAPEQFNPGAKISPAADIFALGMVAYALLVGVPYWRPESTTAGGLIPFITIAVQGPKQSPVVRAASFGVTLPPDFDAWFFRATAFRPEHRFASASEAVTALQGVFEAHMDADVLVTHRITRPPLSSMPILAVTPGTFVPTALPSATQSGAQAIVSASSVQRVSRTPSVKRQFWILVAAFGCICAGAVAFLATHTTEPTSVALSVPPPFPSPSVAPSPASFVDAAPVVMAQPSSAPPVEPTLPSVVDTGVKLDAGAPRAAVSVQPAPTAPSKPKMTKYNDLLED